MKVSEAVGKTYAKAFARPGKAQKINHVLYHLALRGMGYNNGWQLADSGELWFIRNVVARMSQPVVWDVGANIGDYSRALLRFTDAEVVAFEPVPSTFQKLASLTNAYGYRFMPFNFALGAESGSAVIHYGEEASEHASLSREVSAIPFVGRSNTDRVTVHVLRMDDLKEYEGPDFVKIDVEGWEYEVVLGMEQTIAERPPKYIQIEWNMHQLVRGHTLWMFSVLLPGYDVFQLLPTGMRAVDVNDPATSTACYANFVFVRRN